MAKRRKGKKPSKSKGKQSKEKLSKKNKWEGYIKCYYCGKRVKNNALKCKYCGKIYSSGKMAIVGVIAIIAIILLLAMTGFFSNKDEGSGRINPGEIDMDDWSVEEGASIPEEDPDFMGRLNEIYGPYSFSISVMSGERPSFDPDNPPDPAEREDFNPDDIESETIKVDIDSNTNIFIMDMETQTIMVGDYTDITSDTRMVRVWGYDQGNGDVYATDLQLMSGIPGGGGFRPQP